MTELNNLTNINLRELVRQSPRTAFEYIRNQLRRFGYAPSDYLLSDLIEAIDAEIPLLSEGEPGTGKTLLAKILALAFNLQFFRIQCMAGINRETVLGRWEREIQNQFVQQAVHAGMSLAEAREEQWKSEYYSIGDALKAYVESTKGQSSLLLIDEIDKLTEEDEDIFLQLLEEKGATIPKLGFIGLPAGAEPPIVILTSNNLRTGVSSPLRSRCLYTYIDQPTLAEEIIILKTQVPEASNEILAQTVKLINQIRLDAAFIRQPPQLRESVRFLKALVRKDVREITPAIVQQHLCHIATNKPDRLQLGDRRNTASNATERLSEIALARDPEIDSTLLQALQIYKQQTEEVSKI